MRGIFGDVLRANPEHVVEADARIGHAKSCRPAPAVLLEAARHDRGDLAVAVLQLEAAHRLGDVAHGAVVVERLRRSSRRARGARSPRSRSARASCAGRLPRRCRVTRPLRSSILVDFGAAVRIDVPFRRDVVAGADELLFRLVAVEPDERRIGADHPAVERGAEHAVADALVEIAEACAPRAARRRARDAGR